MKTASIFAILFVSLPAFQFFLPSASAAGEFDDAYEENDGIAEAWGFSYNEGYISGLNQSDDDWYYYDVNPHDKITVNIYYTESEAIMNVSLYNSSEILLATEVDIAYGHKRVEFTNTHDQNEFVYLRVFGNNSMKLYDLQASFDYVFDLEPNNILEDASKLHFPGFFSGGIQENDDWFEIWVEANKSLHVFLRDWSYSNKINITLFDGTHSIIAIPYESSSENNKLQWINPFNYDTSVYLLVNGTNESTNYELDLDLIIDIEPNNIPSEAVELPHPGNYDNGMVQEGYDYYKIFLENGDFVKFYLNNPNYGSYNINMTLLNSSLAHVSTGFDEYSDGNVYLNYTHYGDGQWYYILIDGDNMGGSYSLEFYYLIDIEPNNDFGSASLIYSTGFYDHNWLGEEDWFCFNVSSGEEIEVRLNDLGSSEPMSFEIYNSTNDLYMTSWDKDGEQYVSLTNNDIGQFYYIRVYSSGMYMAYGYQLEIRYPFHEADDDWLEENDDLSSATWIGPSHYDLIQKDADWFNTTIPGGDMLEVSLSFNGASNDIDLFLYDQYNALLNSSTGIGDWEHVSYFAEYTMNVSFLVSGNGNGEPYCMDVNSYYVGTGPSDDWLEENDDPYSASWIGPSHYDLIQMDNDWFNTTIPGGDMLEISLNFNGSINDMDLYLYDQYGTLLNMSTGAEDWEKVTYYAENSLNVSFLVVGDNNGEPYSMDVYSYYIPMGSSDDTLEENDNQEQAAWITSGYYSDLYQGDEDWYNISVSLGSVLEVELWFNGSSNDVDFELFNSFGDTVGGSYSASDYESFIFRNMQESQIISIKVYGYNNFEPYTMNIDIYPDSDDWMEDNDFNNQAHFLYLPFEGENLRNFDDDWYEFHLETNDVADIYFDLIDASYPLQVEIWTQSWELIFNVTVTGPHTISVEANYNPSDYFMRVSGYNLGEIYNLEIFLNGLSVNSDDWFEPNDYPVESTDLLLPFEDWGLRSFNEDWYDIDLAGGDYIDIFIWNSNPTDNLRLVVFDPSWTEIKNQTIYADSNGPIYINPAESGTYYILITSDSNDFFGNHYDLRIDLNGERFNDDDWAEENDVQTNSHQLSNNNYYSDLVCMDDDWFYFGPILSQETLSVELRYDTVNNLVIELFDGTGAYHGFQVDDQTWGKLLTWTAGGYFSTAYLLISGDFNTPYSLDLRVSTTISDDWAEENDDISSAKDLSINRHNGLIQNDMDWYKIWLEPNDLLDIILEYDNALPGLWMDLDLYEWSSTAESLLVSGTNDNGKNILSYTNENLAKYVYIRVNGPNNGDWYDLDLTLNPSTSPEEPSLDWVAYTSGDFAEWDATVEIFNEGGNSTLFEGSLRGDITDVQLGEHSVIVSSNMQWSNIPTEYLQGWITGAYNFDIEGDGFAYPAYFGFASVFVGDGFHYSDTQKIFTNIFDTSYDILDDGRTLEVEYNPSEGPYYKMRVTYTEDGFLKEISIEGDFVDAVGNIFAYGKIHLLLSSSSVVEEIKTDDTMTNSTDDGNGTGADSNPFSGFDLSSIPGFPAEIIGGVLGLTIIAMIVAVKKKSKKVF